MNFAKSFDNFFLVFSMTLANLTYEKKLIIKSLACKFESGPSNV